MFVCLFQERTSSIKIPKYSTWICSLSLQLLSLISSLLATCFNGDPNMISLFLASFIENLVSLKHWTKCFNSLMIIDSLVPSFLTGNIRLGSSTKWWMLALKGLRDSGNKPCQKGYSRKDRYYFKTSTSFLKILVSLLHGTALFIRLTLFISFLTSFFWKGFKKSIYYFPF